jgi:hypothetical protein
LDRNVIECLPSSFAKTCSINFGHNNIHIFTPSERLQRNIRRQQSECTSRFHHLLCKLNVCFLVTHYCSRNSSPCLLFHIVLFLRLPSVDMFLLSTWFSGRYNLSKLWTIFKIKSLGCLLYKTDRIGD